MQTEAIRIQPGKDRQLLVCRGTGCESQKADVIYFALLDELKKAGLADKTEVKFTGCHGLCQMGPTIIIEPGGTFYCNVMPEDVPEIIDSGPGQGGCGRPAAVPGSQGQEEGSELQGHGLFRAAAADCFAQLRFHQSRGHRQLPRGGGLQGDPEGLQDDPDGGHRRGEEIGAPRARGRRLLHGDEVGILLTRLPGTRSTSSATPTKATRERSWTARYSKAIPTVSSRGC